MEQKALTSYYTLTKSTIDFLSKYLNFLQKTFLKYSLSLKHLTSDTSHLLVTTIPHDKNGYGMHLAIALQTLKETILHEQLQIDQRSKLFRQLQLTIVHDLKSSIHSSMMNKQRKKFSKYAKKLQNSRVKYNKSCQQLFFCIKQHIDACASQTTNVLYKMNSYLTYNNIDDVKQSIANLEGEIGDVVKVDAQSQNRSVNVNVSTANDGYNLTIHEVTTSDDVLIHHEDLIVLADEEKIRDEINKNEVGDNQQSKQDTPTKMAPTLTDSGSGDQLDSLPDRAINTKHVARSVTTECMSDDFYEGNGISDLIHTEVKQMVMLEKEKKHQDVLNTNLRLNDSPSHTITNNTGKKQQELAKNTNGNRSGSSHSSLETLLKKDLLLLNDEEALDYDWNPLILKNWHRRLLEYEDTGDEDSLYNSIRLQRLRNIQQNESESDEKKLRKKLIKQKRGKRAIRISDLSNLTSYYSQADGDHEANVCEGQSEDKSETIADNNNGKKY